MFPFSNQDTSALVNKLNCNLVIEQCFICSSEINKSVETFDPHLCTRFQAIVGQYLDIRLTELGVETLENFSLKKSSSNNEKHFHFLCDGCLPMVKSFCDLYENWCLLQIRMNQSLKEIGDLMKNTTKNRNVPNANNNQERNEKSASLFRNRFLHRVEDGSLDETPRLKLQRLDDAVDDHDDSLGGNDDEDGDCILIKTIGDPYAGPNRYPAATILDTPSENQKTNHVTMVTTDNTKAKASSSSTSGIPLPTTLTTSTTPEQFQCRLCKLLMPSQASRNRHEFQSHKVDHYQHELKLPDYSKTQTEVIYKCAHRNCKETFSTVFELRKHRDQFHRAKPNGDHDHIGGKRKAKNTKISEGPCQESQSDKRKTFNCGYCDQAFSTITLRKLHEKSHENQPCYVCGIGGCAQTFATSSDLLFHRRFDRHGNNGDGGTEETEIKKECVDKNQDDDDDGSFVYQILPN